ncbi:FAD-dependent thymidylate synthase [Saccharothrix sp. HUAS TT1]|uniref:FAD-dependent thymidylate synthase n=1 Tax=unclassified Saccharothrix TaxID=2593673 RepID=UPI00345BD995
MKVTPIAYTSLVGGLAHYDIEEWMEYDLDSTEADALAEFAGRSCYQSFHKPNPATEANRDYLANILNQEHESVLEHASVTFYVTGVSRALTHELIRHRHLSFSELSQRFVNVEGAQFVTAPALAEHWDEFLTEDKTRASGVRGATEELYQFVRYVYADLVSYLHGKGMTRKKAREAARSVMPNATETRIVVTGNIRAWRWVIKKRFHAAADAEIRQFAGEVLNHLREIAPHSVQDIPEEPYS